jgi:hypothetical protein
MAQTVEQPTHIWGDFGRTEQPVAETEEIRWTWWRTAMEGGLEQRPRSSSRSIGGAGDMQSKLA